MCVCTRTIISIQQAYSLALPTCLFVSFSWLEVELDELVARE